MHIAVALILAQDLIDNTLTSVNWQCYHPFICSKCRGNTIKILIPPSKGVKSGPYWFVLAELMQPDPHLLISVSNSTEISTYVCF